MKKIINTLALGAAVTLLASCDLDLMPNNAIAYNPEQIVETASDLNGFENGMFSYFRGTQYGVYNIASEVMCDGFNAMADFGNNYGSIHRTDNSFSATDYDAEDHWENIYHAIMRYNVVINGLLENVPADLQAKAAVVRGEGYFFRADSYLRLVRLYAKAYAHSTPSSDLGVPLVLEYDQTARPARNTIQEVYDQIGKDLDSAAVLLAGVKGEVRAQKPTIDAVNALYARYYLDMKDYESAAECAQAVIATGKYTLANSAAAFTKEFLDDEGTEPIMQMFASLNEAPNGLNNYTRLTTANGQDVYSPIDSYDPADLRLAGWFQASGDDSYPIYSNGSAYSDSDVLVFTKFEGNTSYTTNPLPQGQQAIKPFRISEMYLIAAEALFQDGSTSNAIKVLNDLQTARGAELTVLPSFEAIQKEWFIETVGEGQRAWCLKRWNTGFTARYGQTAAISNNLIYTGNYYTNREMAAGDYHLTLPIPTYEIKINPNLKQNEGYDLISE